MGIHVHLKEREGEQQLTASEEPMLYSVCCLWMLQVDAGCWIPLFSCDAFSSY